MKGTDQMNIPTIVMTALVLLATGVAALFFLARKAHVERSIIVEAPAEDVFALVRTVDGFNQFNPFKLRDPQLRITPNGAAAGVGAGFSWKGKEGRGTQTIIREVTDKAVVMQLDLGPQGRPVQTLAFAAVDGGTRVTWSLDADFGANPIARLFGLVLDRFLGPAYESGLRQLKTVVEA
jgi:ribosome-associated toxin RatA of RatAB toxin-antitoxin module